MILFVFSPHFLILLMSGLLIFAASRGRPGSAASKANIKVEKSAKLDLDSEPEKTPVLPSGAGRKSASPVPSSCGKSTAAKKATPKATPSTEEVDAKA